MLSFLIVALLLSIIAPVKVPLPLEKWIAPWLSTPVPEIVNDSTRVKFPEIFISKVAPLLIVVPDGLFPRAFSLLIEIVPYLIVVVPHKC